ncbi:unnamed protein product [marine sediment metagenome]|uniref:Uncharacterized protein n=1 Tax=marine sediment metagenome TaxID=412755 RepID=X1G1R0_9ZZZZ
MAGKKIKGIRFFKPLDGLAGLIGRKGAAEKIADIVLNSGLKKNNQIKELIE